MATKVSFTFQFPLEKPSKAFKKKPSLALSHLSYCDGFGFSKKNSGLRGELSVKVNALQEVIQSTTSETALLSQQQLFLPLSLFLLLAPPAASVISFHFILHLYNVLWILLSKIVLEFVIRILLWFGPDNLSLMGYVVDVQGLGKDFAWQLVVAALLNRNIKSRLIFRDPEKAVSLFGNQDEEKLQIFKGDTRNPADLDPSLFEGVTHVICCTGTTAFPSKRWDGDNTPERVDWEGVSNLVSALPSSLKRVVLVSSIGVTKFNELPWSIMNLFGVLKYKKKGEDFLRNSGLPFTIIRAGRLTDGPYTSYDLNTLLRATAGQRRRVVIGQGMLNLVFEWDYKLGEGPGTDPEKWQELFETPQA
ncbi:NAD(P)-binding Rossmann-fold superfamily protein isoform 2 [Hibiscus syriacus]|uniref:NAD(P)-binding Rossmann-fold superfamily protein isoform 2 n=1 Tax=Hibiscus syriacus TaxID=106335 RepID=A0A6A2ZK27_HIBSY|nr:NAD(P)-binding Rossmann-fold superfamily protein isoform 2 [Hibiscus syriacus]